MGGNKDNGGMVDLGTTGNDIGNIASTAVGAYFGGTQGAALGSTGGNMVFGKPQGDDWLSQTTKWGQTASQIAGGINGITDAAGTLEAASGLTESAGSAGAGTASGAMNSISGAGASLGSGSAGSGALNAANVLGSGSAGGAAGMSSFGNLSGAIVNSMGTSANPSSAGLPATGTGASASPTVPTTTGYTKLNDAMTAIKGGENIISGAQTIMGGQNGAQAPAPVMTPITTPSQVLQQPQPAVGSTQLSPMSRTGTGFSNRQWRGR